ncbi:hypothetical protein B2A_07856 [mine drainage metagenome]|uniref:Uncharacterized protein n=1 Tax=mine drainage metagenome TaxID=410659 RepID=T0ZVV9_9ZZZZ
MADDHEVPTWLYCQDILLSIKEELIAEALDTLNNEIAEHRIDIQGSMVTAQEGSEDIEKKMFVIENLRHKADEIRDQYKSYLRIPEHEKTNLDPDLVGRLESMKKFLLAVTQITMLMDYSEVFDEWARDMGHGAKGSKPIDLLISTMDHGQRCEALEFASKRHKVMAYLGEQDAEIVRDAVATHERTDSSGKSI